MQQVNQDRNTRRILLAAISWMFQPEQWPLPASLCFLVTSLLTTSLISTPADMCQP